MIQKMRRLTKIRLSSRTRILLTITKKLNENFERELLNLYGMFPETQVQYQESPTTWIILEW